MPPVIELIQKTFPDAEPASGVTFDLISDDPRRREELIVPPGDQNVFNGFETVCFSRGNAQADLCDNSEKCAVRIHVAGVADFARSYSGDGAIARRADGTVTLEKTGDPAARVVADEKTGFVYRDTMSYNDGKSRKEYWGFAPKGTPEGLVFPSLSVEADIQRDRITTIWIKRIESVDLTSPIPPEIFATKLPAGALILDYRDGRDDTYRGVLRAPVTDLVAWADQVALTRKRFIPPVKPGDQAPSIKPAVWLDQTGKTEAPKLDGKVVLVDFWGVSCGPCIGQLPEVREAVEHFKGTDIRIIGLHDSSGTVKEVSEFAAKRGLAYPLAIDRPSSESGWFGATFAAYGVRGIPGTAVLDRHGRIVFIGQFSEAVNKAGELLK
ncbi:TlpA disulfide reductase family protein [Paludisphaera borealis]|uniref:Thiol-disulfide oxidoreductase ResA n=1 Tax=Paludisphaera borealis TaxID=1387353 RepID=A0A1U7CZ34_9BACT|nr:TlpA disulfide reductase family protein [Paludisphaera borealis]APW64217.1 Thiol-disulfide oxidoreductase ResA [Paludisphaera borealis]